jgi:hypothetical protein
MRLSPLVIVSVDLLLKSVIPVFVKHASGLGSAWYEWMTSTKVAPFQNPDTTVPYWKNVNTPDDIKFVNKKIQESSNYQKSSWISNNFRPWLKIALKGVT